MAPERRRAALRAGSRNRRGRILVFGGTVRADANTHWRSHVAQEIPDGIVMEPVFVIEATYGPDAAELRPPLRPTHLARIAALRAAGVVVEAGGFPDMSGSLLLVRAPDADSALAIAREDVYMREGVWVEARVRPFVRVARPDEVPA